MTDFTWTKRPRNGQHIEAFSTVMENWYPGVYYDEGADGIIEWPNGDTCELEEYKTVITKWRPRPKRRSCGHANTATWTMDNHGNLQCSICRATSALGLHQ